MMFGLALCAGIAAGFAVHEPLAAPLGIPAAIVCAAIFVRAARASRGKFFLVALLAALPWLEAFSLEAPASMVRASMIGMAFSSLPVALVITIARPLFARATPAMAFLGASIAGALDMLFPYTGSSIAFCPEARWWMYPRALGAACIVGGAGWTLLVVLGCLAAGFALATRGRSSLLATAAGAFGMLAIGMSAPRPAEGPETTVGVLQFAGDDGTPDPLVLPTLDAARIGANVIVWPEVSLADSPVSNASLDDQLSALARRAGVTLVAPFRRTRAGVNSVAVYGADGRRRGVAEKLHPAWQVGEISKPGTKLDVFATEIGPLAAAICYDAYFPSVVRDLAGRGIGILTVPADSVEPAVGRRYPAMMAVISAIESGVPVAVAERTGTSRIVDARGSHVALGRQGAPFALGTVRTSRSPSIYARTNGALAWLLGVLALLFGLLG